MQDYIPRETDINGEIGTVVVKQYDNLSRYIHLQIMDDDLSAPMNLVGCEVRLYADLIEDIGYIDGEVADGENGVITFLLPNGLTQKAGEFQAEVWITNANETSVISTKPFTIAVGKSLRDERRLEATGQFSALENALFQVTINKARINAMTSLSNAGSVTPGTVDSEVVDIRTGYDGTAYPTAGEAVRGQIQDIHDSVATTAEFLAVLGEDYDENEEVNELVSDLQTALKQANAYKYQVANLSRAIENLAQLLSDNNPDDSEEVSALVSGLQALTSEVSALKGRMDAESQAVSNEVSTLKTLVASITQQVTGITQQIENINASQSSDTVADGISAGTVAAMLQCAETYFNYAYTPDGKDSGILYESHTGLYSTSLGSNAANKQYGIVCSSFVCAILNAISFGNSRYNGRSTNLKYNWGVEFDDTGVFGTSDSDQNSINYKYLSSYNLAKYAAEHNYFYTINANATIRPGDVVFHVDDSLTDGRYLKIDHVAIIINTDGTNCTIVESWPSTKTDIDKTTHDVGLQIRQRELSYFAYGATFPLGNVWNEPKVIESVHNLSGSTTAASDLLTQTVEQGFYTIVCHGTYSDNLYVRKVYTNGSEAVNVDGGLYNIGNVHYLTVYAEKPATIIARMPKESTYDISDITLYKGYADIATAY